jgi:hypothetical protein
VRGVAADALARDERRFKEAAFSVEKHAREGDPAHAITDAAGERNAEPIVVGARGNTRLRRFMLGSVAIKLAQRAQQPVHRPAALNAGRRAESTQWGIHGGPDARHDRRMASLRVASLSTICAAIMCCAGAAQLLGFNRIVVDDAASAARPWPRRRSAARRMSASRATTSRWSADRLAARVPSVGAPTGPRGRRKSASVGTL